MCCLAPCSGRCPAAAPGLQCMTAGELRQGTGQQGDTVPPGELSTPSWVGQLVGAGCLPSVTMGQVRPQCKQKVLPEGLKYSCRSERGAHEAGTSQVTSLWSPLPPLVSYGFLLTCINTLFCYFSLKSTTCWRQEKQLFSRQALAFLLSFSI